MTVRPVARARFEAMVLCVLGALLGALLGAPVALAADASGVPGADARYRQDREHCERIESPEGRASCLREAAAARAEDRRGRLTDRPDDPIRYLENALRRCEPLPPDERADCEYRVRGGGTTRGSVEAGGIFRETVTREVEPPREIRIPDEAPPRSQ
ncbi:MAG: hypothetical protein EHM83_05205 [Burkholderiales bacterium]|nr:MAG: hypothetical protein EHM83_05205 [Burkholderiales bacterium]